MLFMISFMTHLKRRGGDVCLSAGDESLLAKYRTNKELHRKRMRELVERGDVTFRILATKSDFKSFNGYAQFKWQPQEYAAPDRILCVRRMHRAHLIRKCKSALRRRYSIEAFGGRLSSEF